MERGRRSIDSYSVLVRLAEVLGVEVGQLRSDQGGEVERQIERGLLEEALEANEAEAGPIPQELRDEAAGLFRAVKDAPELQKDAGWLGHEAG